MNYIGQIIEFIQRFFIWGVTIMPWEEAVHVRLGKRVRVLKAGLHLRIPFIDRVYVQTTRLRVVQLAPQTLTTKDGKCITLVLNMGYNIVDIKALYSTLFHAEQTLANMISGAVSDIISSRDLAECGPAFIEKQAEIYMQQRNEFGLHFEYVKITTFAVVKTYRLLQESHWLANDLSTDKQKT